MTTQTLEQIHAALDAGLLVPYLGPGVLALAGADCPLPVGPDPLVAKLTAKASVPHKIRKNLSAAAQFIENFKHRKTISAVMTEAFKPHVEPTTLHNWIASWPKLPLVVHSWYDDLPQQALAVRENWGFIQGVSQAEHLATWVRYFDKTGAKIDKEAELAAAEGWATVLYQPWGSVAPEGNFLVSDSDFVEVLTEIDIQTPIPEKVQSLRSDRSFLFLGCRFMTQLERIFAWQIMKRSSEKHWAVLPETPTKNEVKFLERYNVERIDMPLADFVATMASQKEAALA
ncbi:SIR2 family NAD-dependent protein deacylase [Methylocapsa acidiphila]|uniref:SIR2 family NAD-dependent protein deacylase n=1 Tax=Methylocapsa acidiphila TaxID=133552 RepID=UPI00041CEA6C|nr:SIR2 family protein [Methylocapsa acidiphila]